jgi:hypothetical protein
LVTDSGQAGWSTRASGAAKMPPCRRGVHANRWAVATVHRRGPNLCGRTRAKSAQCGHLHAASCLKMQKSSVQNRCECNSIRCYTRQQRKEAHILSLVVNGSRLHRVKWVVRLVRVLLQTFFGCLSCLSFELDAMLAMASLKRANGKGSKHLCPTDSETLTNASWLDTRCDATGLY